ncbi:MAG: SEC-C metal-binding domain-containing protein, partial [Oscillospiraceae bacterium]
ADLMTQFKIAIDQEHEEVVKLGGLHIVGTERHESRRIDNQLRGRAGRQGDPGETRFFLSLEDDLMRLFGGEKIQSLMNTFKVEEDVPIEAKILSSTIQSAQSKVESRNFGIRKNVLQFDDVMNRQREMIYSQRRAVLDGEDLHDTILRMMDGVIADAIDTYLPDGVDKADWNLTGLRDHLAGWVTGKDDLHYTIGELDLMEKSDLRTLLCDRVHTLYAAREAKWSEPITRELERMVLLKNVDSRWMDHIDAMEELRRGIYLRSYGQRDPVIEYRVEGSDMYDEMVAAIRADTVRILLTLQLRTEQPIQREQVAKPDMPRGDGTASQPVKKSAKVGRNDPCPCGSGLKYKKCCGR